MIYTRRSLLLLGAAAAGSAFAQQDEGPRRLILDASRALQAGNAARFLSYFDKTKFTEFPALRRTVTALTQARTIASSVDILSLAANDAIWNAEVDWLLQLTPISGAGSLERRQETATLTIAKNSKDHWLIASFSPIELFRVL